MKSLIALAGLALLTSPTLAADTPAESAPAAAAAAAAAETAIPFIRSGGIIDWKADGDRAVFIRSMNGNWYRAQTMARCGRLQSALSIGFETGGPDQLDRFGALRVEGWRCPLASVTRSEAPPSRRRR